MTIEQKILEEFHKTKELTVKELTFKLQVSKQMIHLVLNKLVHQKIVEKLGRTPKTVYRLIDISKAPVDTSLYQNISDKDKKFLKENFLLVTEMGSLIEGVEAFDSWCRKRKLPLKKTMEEFIKTKNKYNRYYNQKGLVDGTQKMISTYGKETFLDQISYLDFYAIERFGKTRLGTLLHYAKQGQNKFLMRKMMNEIHEKITGFIKNNKFDAIGFIPPTIRREVQIMKFIQEDLNVVLPILDIKKISGIIPVPQKSLSKLNERITNAENTFAVTDQRKFKKVLLIDDAVGSGSTLNKVAEKIKAKNIAKKVFGLAIVGSFKGFDVITDI